MSASALASPTSARPSPPPGAERGFTCADDRARDNFLVYRHRLAPPSEIGFLSRFYAGFERLSPVWLGYHVEAGADALTGDKLRLGRAGPVGAIDRALFRHFGRLPGQPDLPALRPRLVHAHFGRGGAIALPIARSLGIPLVVTFHGADATKETHYRRRLVPRVYARRLAALRCEAALFVCVSEFVRDRLLERGFPAAKLEVIHQGVDIAPSSSMPDATAEPRLVFVGRFVEKKGVSYLIDAMRLLHERGNPARLVLFGDGPLAGALREQASGLDRVCFAGWLPNAEVRRQMRAATAVCVPSVAARDGDSEGLPTVIFEAMAEGVPIIASDHAGIGEAVAHNRAGLLVPPGDPGVLAHAIETLIANPELRRHLGTAARAAAAERFDVIRQSRRLETALLRVIGESSR